MEKETDIVIVGTGAAGLFCALQLPESMEITIITKDEAQNSDSFLAQGGICVLRSEDDFESYFEDTMKAGHYRNNQESVEMMIRSSKEIIDLLLGYGVEFERRDGELAYTREGGHSRPRILFHADVTGKEITGKLLEQARARKNIAIYEHTEMLDLLCKDNVCYGIVAACNADALGQAEEIGSNCNADAFGQAEEVGGNCNADALGQAEEMASSCNAGTAGQAEEIGSNCDACAFGQAEKIGSSCGAAEACEAGTAKKDGKMGNHFCDTLGACNLYAVKKAGETGNVSCKTVRAGKAGEVFPIRAKQTVLACGGIGGLYRHSTNFAHLTGDGLAVALRHQVRLQDVNFVQIHPTTLYSEKPGRRFLISESVRGEGAVLYNAKMERFVDELLPRDIVTAAIEKQMEEDKKPYVWLSMEHIAKEDILSHFPNIYQRCLEEGYDVTKECIPVVPGQHYFMGGVQSDLEGRTSMERLYAVGETSCNGVHGANRLASNSLLESLVFARRAALDIASGPMPEVEAGKTAGLASGSMPETQAGNSVGLASGSTPEGQAGSTFGVASGSMPKAQPEKVFAEQKGRISQEKVHTTDLFQPEKYSDRKKLQQENQALVQQEIERMKKAYGQQNNHGTKCG